MSSRKMKSRKPWRIVELVFVSLWYLFYTVSDHAYSRPARNAKGFMFLFFTCLNMWLWSFLLGPEAAPTTILLALIIGIWSIFYLERNLSNSNELLIKQKPSNSTIFVVCCAFFSTWLGLIWLFLRLNSTSAH